MSDAVENALRGLSQEVISLPFPLGRKRLQELGQPCRRPRVQNALDDVRGEERESQYAAHVASPDAFGVGEFGQRPVLHYFQHPPPPPSARERLDERAIRVPPARALGPHRDTHDERVAVQPRLDGSRHAALLSSCRNSPTISRAPGPSHLERALLHKP
jgi:hypothetical protein